MADETLLDPYALRPHIRRWEHHPGFARGTVGPRELPDHEFVLITSHGGWYEDDAGRRGLVPGDLYLLRPKHRHAFQWGPYGTWHCFIHFDFDTEQRQPLGDVRLAGARPFPNPLHLGLGTPAGKFMLDIARAVKPGSPWCRLRWRGAFLNLMALLCDGPLRPAGSREGADPEALGSSVNEWRVRRALDVLDKRLGDPQLAAGDLAAAAGLSEPHFRRLCREVTGRGPLDVIRRRRLTLARRLLLDPQQPIAAVSRACGFDDPRYFARLFRQEEGLSPQEYRAAILAGR
ncbi:MAG: hypothetical protein AMXMBFR7_30400 [Planctomycetota bacterium]